MNLSSSYYYCPRCGHWLTLHASLIPYLIVWRYLLPLFCIALFDVTCFPFSVSYCVTLLATLILYRIVWRYLLPLFCISLFDVTCFPYSVSYCLTLLANLILYRIVLRNDSSVSQYMYVSYMLESGHTQP